MRVLIALLFLLDALYGASISWERNYPKALAKAKRADKALMVYLYLPHCGTCSYMNKNVFTDRDVVDYLEKNYVAVKLYTNDRGLPDELKSEMAPVFHFMDPQSSKRIETVMGGKNAEKFLELLEESYDIFTQERRK